MQERVTRRETRMKLLHPPGNEIGATQDMNRQGLGRSQEFRIGSQYTAGEISCGVDYA
jgi:hypothetical protein